MTKPLEIRSADLLAEFPSLLSEGGITFANVSESFVLMDDIPLPKMLDLVNTYCDQHDEVMRQLFLAPSSESMPNPAQSRISKGSESSIKNMRAPFALRIEMFDQRRGVKPTPVPRFSTAKTISAAIEAAGYTFEESVYSPPYWDVVNQPYETQRAVAEVMLSGDATRTMSWAKRGLRDRERVASQNVLALAKGATSTLELLTRFAVPLLSWINDEFRSNARGNKEAGVRPERPFAVAWFGIWLAERGYWLFPRGVLPRMTELVPHTWHPFRTQLIPEDRRDFWVALVEQITSVSNPTALLSNDIGLRNLALGNTRSALTALRLASTWRGHPQISADLFSFLGRASELNAPACAYRSLWDVCKRELTNLDAATLHKEDAKLRANRARLRNENPAWQWVTDVGYRPYGSGEKYFRQGFVAGPRLRAHVEELRALLPKLTGKVVTYWRTPLEVWFLYLSTLPDEEVPRRVLDIERERHIDSARDSQRRTFCQYLASSDIPLRLRSDAITRLEDVWTAAFDLALPAERPALRHCPIQLRFDRPRLSQMTKVQTHRRPLDEEILLFLIATNREDDFAFSRSRRTRQGHGRLIDVRRVTDPETGQVRTVWFPGVAVLMDLLLNVPLRKKQARFLDSGEGDEYSIDIKTLELKESGLPTATAGRQAAFFRRFSTSLMEDRAVLGMFINTNKTGRPYDVPWIPLDVAGNVQRLIDWQKKYNPISEPASDMGYLTGNSAADEKFSEPVWPIFRDPSDLTHEPIKDQKLQSYFEMLMEHCEKKFNEKSGRGVSFFRDEPNTRANSGSSRQPIIDLHSLRVTGVTILVENGVPLEVVKLLVGHASIAMTCYYHVIESRAVHEELMRAIESRAPAVDRLQRMTPQEFASWSEKFAVNQTSDSGLAVEMLADSIKWRNPGWDYKYHGLCAGGDCRYGGPPDDVAKQPRPLWRGEACSLCRYRVTGAPWLVGLVHHVNQLWWELRQCSKDLVELQLRRDAAEDCGSPVRSLLGDIERAKIRRDNLFEEWIAEVNYVNRAKADLDEWVAWLDVEKVGSKEVSRNGLVLRSPLGDQGITTQLQMVHELSQLTELVRGARILESAILPRGIQEDRNAILLEIARSSNLHQEFMRLSARDTELALDAFADMVLDVVGSDPDTIEDLVQGRVTIQQHPVLQERLLKILPAPVVASLLCLQGGKT